MGFELEAYLGAQRARVDRALEARMSAYRGAPPRLAEAMAYSLLAGGKRLRPLLTFAFADAVGRRSDVSRAVEDAACAVEMVHTYSLVHDDLPAMDDDDLRRGRPTNHKVYGEALAILAGDALLTLAFETLSRGSEPVRAELCGVLASAAGASGMIGGQVLDMAEDRPAELAYLNRLHGLKTGALLRASCELGCLAAGGSEVHRAMAVHYGEAVGLAFQIADDLLDVTSSAEELGKPAGADAKAGRPTFPAVVGVAKARELATEQVAAALHAISSLEPEPGPLAALARYAVERKA